MRFRNVSIRLKHWQANRKIITQIARVEAHLRARDLSNGLSRNRKPVLFFNASTRINLMSFNAIFSMLASWAVWLEGIPVWYVVCHRGMLQCMLGTQRQNMMAPPPCDRCVRFSRALYPADRTVPLAFSPIVQSNVEKKLRGMSLSNMVDWVDDNYPFGELCVPSLRWALRRHNLPDDEPTRRQFRHFLASAASLVLNFESIYRQLQPRAVVLFNGITFPEAVARSVALKMGIHVITHEVGLRPYSAFFSHEHATFREVDISQDFELGLVENQQLDDYLEARRSGNFTMAGIRFWPHMQSIPPQIAKKVNKFRQLVVIFTNVVFDTSQVHANKIYPHMFVWLDDVKQAIVQHQDTYFLIRAHPDEKRYGKESQESVADWVQRHGLRNYSNVDFISPSQYVSSYELIKKSKFVMVYNSSIGLEASIMGSPVLCAGRARYTQIPIVFFPESRTRYKKQLTAFLKQDEIEVDPEFVKNARRFLYFELYHASLDFSQFMEPYPEAPGNAVLSRFDPGCLETSCEINVVQEGILEGKPFVI